MEDVAAALAVAARLAGPVEASPAGLLEVKEDRRSLEPGGHVGALEEQQLVGAPVRGELLGARVWIIG